MPPSEAAETPAPRYGARAIAEAELERWPNAAPERDYEIAISLPEFTCLCPRSGYPDFARLELRYVPDRWVVELRSIKLYVNAYRELAIAHEAVTNRILDDLVAATRPRLMEVRGEWFVRGGITTYVTASHVDEDWDSA